jgi:poly-gamma-glutamate synthesis protein (capsule biosynthesis protein)
MAASRRVLICLAALVCLCGAARVSAGDAPAEDRLVLSFAGDCTLGSEGKKLYYPSGFVRVVEEKGFDWPFSGVADLFHSDDLTLVNLEGTFTTRQQAAHKRFTFQAPPAYAEILPLGGVEAVNLANNHSLDYGAQGLDDTMAALDAQGVAYCAPERSAVVEVKGRRIALLGFTYPLTRRRLPALYEEIAAYRARGDIALIIVSFHWGIEMQYQRMRDQIEAAHSAIDHGADVVVGTHPHVLQGMEMYNDRPIFYSLGNFSFGGNASPKDFDTVVMRLTYDLTDQGPALAALEALPCSISAQPEGAIQDYRPVRVQGQAAARVLKKLSRGAQGFPDGFFDTGLWNLR